MLAMLGSLGWPLLLGLAGCTLFYAAVFQGVLGSDFFHRYFASHPVSYFATGMFFVGLAALALKLLNLIGQFAAVRMIALDAPRAGGVPVERCSAMLDDLEDLSGPARRSYLGNRLREALEYVERKGNADGLDDELKYLADLDAGRQHDSFGLVRIIIWATPMLGFLGTVVGITQALGDLDPKMLATSIQTAMEGLLAGLYVAFDTTALALSLSIVLMFVQFFVDRIENQLLSSVDERVNTELVGRFETTGNANDPHLASIQRMAEEVIKTSQTLVARQTQLWKTTTEAADQRWAQIAAGFSEQLKSSWCEAMDQSLGRFAERLARTEEDAVDQAQRRWKQWQTALSDNARMLQAQQQEMTKQGDVVARVLEATGDIIRLETLLNENLNSLAGAKNFEDTVMSLAAAIHLLNTRLEPSVDRSQQVDLGQSQSQDRAA